MMQTAWIYNALNDAYLETHNELFKTCHVHTETNLVSMYLDESSVYLGNVLQRHLANRGPDGWCVDYSVGYDMTLFKCWKE